MDLRPFGGTRKVLRDPRAPGWPREGAKTEFEDVAREWAWAYVRQLQGKKYRAQTGQGEPSPRVRDVVPEFLEHRMNTRSQNTYEADRTALSHHLMKTHPSQRLAEIDWQRWADKMLKGGYKANTVRLYLNSVRMLHRYAGLEAPDVSLRSDGSMGVKVWTDEELRLLREAAGRIGMAERLERALSTGMRRNELMASRHEDFNVFTKTALVARQVTRSGGIKPPKGKRVRTTVVLPEYWPHHDPTKTGPIDPPRSTLKMNQDFHALVEEAGLPRDRGVNWHSCRHSFSRIYLEHYGGDLMQLASFLGHSSTDITRRYYGHFSTDAAVRLGRLAVYGEA